LKLHSSMAHQQMLALLQTVHINVGDNKEKKFMQENEKPEAATLVLCTTTAKEARVKILIVKSLSVIDGDVVSIIIIIFS
jgi:hypothetical protein